MCDFLHIIIYIYIYICFKVMHCKFYFSFLWRMVFKLILDKMCVVCSKFDVSGTTCVMDRQQNKVRK
jgi:hypothetical protein